MFSKLHELPQLLRQQGLALFLSEVALKNHRFELRIGDCGECGYQVDGGFLLLEALEEMVVMVRFLLELLLFHLDNTKRMMKLITTGRKNLAHPHATRMQH